MKDLDPVMTIWLPRPEGVTVESGISDHPNIKGKDTIRFVGKVSDLLLVAQKLAEFVNGALEHQMKREVK